MDFGKNAGIKLGIFALVTVAFVAILLFYADARQEGWGSGFRSGITNVEAYADVLNGQKLIEKSFTVQPGGEFVLDTDVGDVAIEGSEGEEVSVSVEVRGDSDDLRKFDVQFRQSDNRVEVRGIWKKRGWRFWDWNGIDARFSIKVPRQFSANVSTAGGDIRLRAVDGVAKLITSGGDVRVQEVQGETSVKTSGGDIIVRQVLGNVHLETSGGDITVSDVQGDTRAETSGGDIRIATPDGRIDAETSGGDIEVHARGENREMYLHTSGGDIVIYVSHDIRATVDASTTGGEVVCELEIATRGKIEDNELHGKINGGGEQIQAETSGGDIYIRALR